MSKPSSDEPARALGL